MHVMLFALVIVLGLAKYIESNFVTDESRQKVKRYLKEWHERAQTPSTTKLLQNNFLLLLHFLNKIYGPGILTTRLIRFTANLTFFFILFVAACTVFVPQSSLAMKPSPSEVFQGAASIVPTVIQNYETVKANPKVPPLKPEQERLYLSILKTFRMTILFPTA